MVPSRNLPVPEATRVERMHARPLTFHRAFQAGPHRRDHRAVVGLVADRLEDLDHRRRERPPVFVADDELLRQLRGLARGERDMPCRRRRLEVLQRAVEETVERARALQLLDRGLHSRIGVTGARRNPLADGHERVASSVSRMTAVEHGDDVRSAGRDLVEQQAQLLVGQRPHELPRVVVPGVEQQQVLDLARRVAERELRGRQFLAPVAGVGEQRDVTLPGLGRGATGSRPPHPPSSPGRRSSVTMWAASPSRPRRYCSRCRTSLTATFSGRSTGGP